MYASSRVRGTSERDAGPREGSPRSGTAWGGTQCVLSFAPTLERGFLPGVDGGVLAAAVNFRPLRLLFDGPCLVGAAQTPSGRPLCACTEPRALGRQSLTLNPTLSCGYGQVRVVALRPPDRREPRWVRRR